MNPLIILIALLYLVASAFEFQSDHPILGIIYASLVVVNFSMAFLD